MIVVAVAMAIGMFVAAIVGVVEMVRTGLRRLSTGEH
jgi:hypothetical protein